VSPVESKAREPLDLTNPILAEFWTEEPSVVDAKLAEIRRQPPAFYPEPYTASIGIGPGAWAITQYDLILEMSRTPEVYSSAKGITVFDLPPDFNVFFSSIIAMDDPRHAHLRRLVSKGFTPRMMQRLEGSIVTQANEIIDEVSDRGSCDFVLDVAARLPLAIVCDLMGVPRSHLDFIFEQTNIILGASDPEYVPRGNDIVSSLLQAGGALAELMTDVASSKKGGDGDDLTSILVNAEIDGEQLSTADIASFFILLVVAGNETTRNAISWGLHYLTHNPDQRRIWQDDLERVTPTAVEEIVRLASPVTLMRRTATRDTMLGGVDIAEGDKLAMFYLAANRDDEMFVDPLQFKVTRSPNRHIGFGGPGPHFCLGAHLARREIGVMFTELFRRLPDIEATAMPDVLQSSMIHGIKHLPVKFTPGG
jgi:cytochrome P450